MFEKLNVQKVWVASQPAMALFATGKTTGLVVECGHGLTQSMPFYEGMPLNHGKDKNQLGGNTIGQYLVKKLGCSEDGAKAAREQVCYVAKEDYMNDKKEPGTALLPDGAKLVVPG